ncbi:MAG TPA: hypothetical protein VL225_17330 [Vicinamibacterales bacterium]|nr:hypothetical protein [Vicinamibacterales bacterium]
MSASATIPRHSPRESTTGTRRDLVHFHHQNHFIDVILLGDGYRRARHHRRRVHRQRVDSLGDRAAHDVAIGDNADDFFHVAALDDGDFAAVVLDHQPRHLLERRVHRAAGGIGRHQVLGGHESS